MFFADKGYLSIKVAYTGDAVEVTTITVQAQYSKSIDAIVKSETILANAMLAKQKAVYDEETLKRYFEQRGWVVRE